MAVDTRIDIRNGITGLVGGTRIPYRFGSSLMPAGQIRMYAGTGATQANVCFVKTWTLAGSANLDVDLTTGQTDINNVAVNLTKVKLVICQITALVAVADYVKIGPQNVTNAIQLWHGDVTANFFTEIRDVPFINGGQNWAGWTVDATHKIIRINNPTANSLSGHLIVIGI
jgi:hypothetical protein